MNCESRSYITNSGVLISRCCEQIKMATALDDILFYLNTQRGGLLTSSYEYPGRYKRWAIGFVNPPLELTTRENVFTVTALNQRGEVLLPLLLERLCLLKELNAVQQKKHQITGLIKITQGFFVEEQRSKQPSAFTIIREILHIFSSQEDEHLGLYGAFGYDLVFQFESVTKVQERPLDQRDLLLYLPDELIIVDYYLQQAFCLQYDFETPHGTTHNLPRTGESINHQGRRLTPQQKCSHQVGEYAEKVKIAHEYFQRGDLFEVVPSQNFFSFCDTLPSKLFTTLKKINPSPYGFIFNLGGEYIIGASPEMFVRVEGKRVETCPISGTITRGKNAIDDADQIRQLLNSYKDEAELTMCTDVDRNDKSRICQPGTVQVIGRRQIELYSHLIHTVDHVEGILRPEFDALDAFLSHTWAVTVTGAPKRAAINFIEQQEHGPRRWYGGAVGYLSFNGDLNTGLILRTIRLKDCIAEVRAGATLLYDSIPQAEEQETITKATALFAAIHQAQETDSELKQCGSQNLSQCVSNSEAEKHILLIDYEDSFVHTLANYIRQTGAQVTTIRHNFSDTQLKKQRPDLVVLSPGPGKPSDFSISQTIATCMSNHIPIFGVCLGLQSIVESFGGKLGVLNYPQHGKSSRIFVTDSESVMFKGLPNSFAVGRYHSLFALQEHLPKVLKVTAISEDNIIMAIEHHSLPIAAVQFHPESIMTLSGEVGLTMIKNVVFSYIN
ncbi:anthranilate synthase [Chrysosporum bergii ANA360D]|uniref:Anthranilate synthase n=1 Tax=Chrysosporum bergii ANA360D TaxID=617107 RepID=A0AA43GV19_9CYAN|nr:anthranilate synthase [Chrysosporum bergii]MDH6061876.1 anthranilate synthase [Chrysosporum bergii ANA360D]